jgi:polyhydroxyalkanoate synthesis regulator protein
MARSRQPLATKSDHGERVHEGAAACEAALAAIVKGGDLFVIHDAKTGEDVPRPPLHQIITGRTSHG